MSNKRSSDLPSEHASPSVASQLLLFNDDVELFKKPRFDLEQLVEEESEQRDIHEMFNRLKFVKKIGEQDLRLKFELHLFLMKCQTTIEMKLKQYNECHQSDNDPQQQQQQQQIDETLEIVQDEFVIFLFDVRNLLYDILFENWTMCKTLVFLETMNLKVQLDMVIFRVITSCTLVLLLYRQHKIDILKNEARQQMALNIGLNGIQNRAANATRLRESFQSLFSKKSTDFAVVTEYKIGMTTKSLFQYTLQDIIDSLLAVEKELNVMPRYDTSLLEYIELLEGVLAKMWMYYQPTSIYNCMRYRTDPPLVQTLEDGRKVSLYGINHVGWQELTSSFLAIRQRCWIHNIFSIRDQTLGFGALTTNTCISTPFTEHFWNRLKKFALENNTSNVMRHFKPIYFFICSRPSELSRFKRECPGKPCQWHKIIKRYRGLAALNRLQERYKLPPERALEDGALGSSVARDCLAVKMCGNLIQNLITVSWEQLYVRNTVEIIEAPYALLSEEDPLMVQDFNSFNVFFRDTLFECHCVACAFHLWLRLTMEHNQQVDFEIVLKQFTPAPAPALPPTTQSS